MNRMARYTLTLALVAALAVVATAQHGAKQLRVLTSGAFASAAPGLAEGFERAGGIKVEAIDAPSVASAPDSIPVRLQRGERVDVVIMFTSGLDDLTKHGKLVPGSRVDLARSGIGVAVRAGAPKPDISSADALKRALLEAKSIAFSSSISGVYVSTELVQRLGIADQVKSKMMRIDRERVGAVVARGDAEIGFQQISELLPVQGIAFLGPLPAPVQRITLFAAAVATNAGDPDSARAFIRYLASPAAAAIIAKSGLEALAPR